MNRGWALSGIELVDHAIEPFSAAERKPVRAENTWALDTTARVARLRTPSKALEQFTVPLRPFLGFVAVAPDGEWIPSSREPGSYGGNLEYAQLTGQ